MKGFRKASDLFLDVHVMIDRPLFFAEKFLSAGADNYTFHYEAVPEEEELRVRLAIVYGSSHRCPQERQV